MESFLLLSGIAAAFFLSAAICKKNEVTENAVLAVIGYFCLYVIISGFLFWLDIFDLRLAAGIAAGLELILLLINRKAIHIREMDWGIKEQWIPLAACIIIVPFIFGKFELYGMGQDEGVYQIKAIALMNGDTKNQMQLETYDLVPEEGKAKYREFIQRKLGGYYLYDDTLPTMSSEKCMGESSGFYHGVPTFAAILALWGSVAGMEHMADIQTIFCFCSIFLLYYICRNLKLEKKTSAVSLLLFVLSPIVIWVAKSTLTEMFLTCLLLLFIYFLTEEKQGRLVLLSAVPMIAYSFFHITIYTILPAIVFLYFFLYFLERKQEYLFANILCVCGFIAGINMMAQIAATYSFTYNFLPLYGLLPFLTQDNVLFLLNGAGVGGILLSFLCYFLMRKRVPLSIRKNEKFQRFATGFVRIMFLAALLLNIFLLVRSGMESGIAEAVRLSTLVGYAVLTGGILFFCAVFGCIFKTNCFCRDKNGCLMGVLFFYFVLIYAAALRNQIPYYYYYGRYLVPYLPFVLLVGAWIINEMTHPKIKKLLLTAAVLIAFAMTFRYNTVLMKEKDDTKLSFEILTECAALFEKGDAVIVEPDVASVLFLPLQHMTDAKIYFRYEDFLEEQIKTEAIQACEGEIYFITDEFYDRDSWENVYTADYTKSEARILTDDFLLFPVKMQKEKCRAYVYQYQPMQTEYDLSNPNLAVNGFYAIEGTARWTNGHGTVYCYLEPADYEIRMKQATLIPIKEFGLGSVAVSLYVNGDCIGEYLITEENKQEDIVFQIETAQLRTGRNELVIHSDKWCPADYGKSDVRRLGLRLESISFLSLGAE